MSKIYNINNTIDEIIQGLLLDKSKQTQIKCFLETVSEYKLDKYIKFVKKNPHLVNELKVKMSGENDNWDVVVFLYRQNIKISASIYPFIYVFETALKTKVNHYMSEKQGENWISHNKGYLSSYKKTRNVISKLDDYKSDQEFIEKETTIGFWTALIQHKLFWCNKKQGICLNEIFINKKFADSELEKIECFADLESIRVLRNKIAHFEDILVNIIFDRKIPYYAVDLEKQKCTDILEFKYNILIVYSNILELLESLNCNEENIVIELKPYSEIFENLYNQTQEIFNKFRQEQLVEKFKKK